MKYSPILIVLAFLFNATVLRAQDEYSAEHGHDHSEGEKHLRHAIGFSIGHTHISTGFKDGDSKWLALPSFGLHYAHSFHPKWALALHSEMIVEDFVVQGSGNTRSEGGVNEDSVIKRGRPIAIALIGMYKIHKHITLFAGGGMEFSEHDDFGLVKVGADFPYHFGNNWEMFGTLSADIKVDAYSSFSFGFGVAKLF